MPQMDAIVTAGGIPAPDELLYPYTQGKPKALLPLAGRPMLQWVLDALGAASSVRRVLVVGLTPEAAALSCSRPLDFLPDQGSMLDNVTGGVRWALERDPQSRQVLVVSSDIPLLTPGAVDWLATTASQTDDEVYYPIITRQVMEGRFPTSRRSYVALRDGVFCGGDLQVVATRVVMHVPPPMRVILDARKNALRQAWLIGFDVLLRVALRLASVPYMERMVAVRLGLHGRGLICPHAEIGMDVDKPFQYELARQELERRA